MRNRKIEKRVQSERHSKKAERSQGRQKLPRPHRELSRILHSSLKRVLLGALKNFATKQGYKLLIRVESLVQRVAIVRKDELHRSENAYR